MFNSLNVDIYFELDIIKQIMEGFGRFSMSLKRNCWQKGFRQSFCSIFVCLTKLF